MEAKQDFKKAIQCCWLAIKRDRPEGAVALAAREQLQQLEDAWKQRRDRVKRR